MPTHYSLNLVMQARPLYLPIRTFLQDTVVLIKSFTYITLIISGISKITLCSNGQRRAAPAHITSRFDDVSVMVGDGDITIECTAIGFPKPVITWFSSNSFHNPGSKINSTPSYFVSSGQLIVKSTKTLMKYFFCGAANKYGTALLSPVHVQVLDRDAFGTNIQVHVENIYLSKNYVMKCRTKTTYVHKDRCRWQINSKNMPVSKRYSYDDQGNLYFIQIQKDDIKSTEYSCTCPTNLKGSTVNEGSKTTLLLKGPSSINVTRKMSIWYVSKDAEKTVNSRHFMRCIPDGIPIPNVMWMKDGKSLTKPNHTILSDYNRHLEIKPLEESDDGIYTCYLVEDSSIRRNMHLKVVSKPIPAVIYSPLVLIGHNRVFTCDGRTANGHATVNGTWLINAKKMPYYYNNTLLTIRGSNLTILSAGFPGHLMTLTCRLINRYGATHVGYDVNIINKTQILKTLITVQYRRKTKNIFKSKKVVTVDPGALVTFEIIFKADEMVHNKLRYTWYKDRQRITSRNASDLIYILRRTPNILVMNDSRRMLRDSISAVYTCLISISGYRDADVWTAAIIKNSATILKFLEPHSTHFPIPSNEKTISFLPFWVYMLIPLTVIFVVVLITACFLHCNKERLLMKQRMGGIRVGH